MSKNCLILFLIGFVSLSVAFSVFYYGLSWYFTIGVLPRMIPYQHQHPFQYIGIISLIFGIVGSLWIHYYGRTIGSSRRWTMSAALLVTVLISSPICGILWEIHDMLAGYIPENQVIWIKLYQGVEWGIFYGWLIVLLSIPLNLIGLAVGYASLNKLSKFSRHQTDDNLWRNKA